MQSGKLELVLSLFIRSKEINVVSNKVPFSENILRKPGKQFATITTCYYNNILTNFAHILNSYIQTNVQTDESNYASSGRDTS